MTSGRTWPKGTPSIRLEPSGDTAICICRACIAYSTGTDAATLAYDEGLADARPVLRLLREHGTPRRVYRGGSARRRDAGPPLLSALALALLLACGTEARGRPSIPALPSEATKASPALRSLRAAHAEAAYQLDPLSRLTGGELLRVSNLPQFVTTDNRIWTVHIWARAGERIGIVVLQEWPGEGR